MNTPTHASPAEPALTRANPLFPPPPSNAQAAGHGCDGGQYTRAAYRMAVQPAPLQFASALDAEEMRQPRSRLEDVLRGVVAYGLLAFGALFPVFAAVYAWLMRG